MKHRLMKRRSKTHALLVIATSAALWLAAAAEAQSHRTHRAGAHRSNGHRATAVSQPAPRQTQYPRYLAGGLSAANVRPGFYRQLDAPQHRGGHGHGGAVPVPVYVYPTYYPEPFYTTTAPAPAPSEPAAPAAPPIYIITPPVVTAPPAAPAPAPPAAPPTPRSTEPGEVMFSVLPTDALVYLDDDYLGTGAELAALPEATRFPPGVHVLEVTHPDHQSQRLVFGVSHTDPAHVLIDLSIDQIGRRTRIK